MVKQQPAVILAEKAIDPDKLILEGIDTSREPHYSVSEVAKFFFGKSSHWVRWCERKGTFVFEGEEVGTQRTESGSRVYCLGDVEKMGHALASKGIITGAQLMNVMHLVYYEAKVWGYV